MLLFVIVSLLLVIALGAKKAKCSCKKEKGSDPNCPVCHPGRAGEWVTHKGEDLGVTTISIPTKQGQEKGVNLSKETGK